MNTEQPRTRMDYLRAKAQLQKRYGEAIQEDYKDGFAIPKVGEYKPTRLLAEEMEDKTLQNNLLLDNLKSIMRPEEASRLLSELDDDTKVFVNRNFTDIKNELKGRVTDATFFRGYLQRYIDRFRSTGNTGLITPLTPENLEEQLDNLNTSLSKKIGDSRAKTVRQITQQIDTLRPFFDRLAEQSADTAQIVIERLTTAIERNDARTAQRILEIVQRLEATGDFRQEELLRVLQDIQNLSDRVEQRVYLRTELEPTIPLHDIEFQGIDFVQALNLRIQTIDTLKNLLIYLKVPNRSRYKSRGEIIEAVQQSLQQLEEMGIGPEAIPEQRDTRGRLPPLEVPEGSTFEADREDYALFFYIPKANLEKFIDEAPDRGLKEFVQSIFSRSPNAWRGASKPELAYTVYKYLQNRIPRNIDEGGEAYRHYLQDNNYPFEAYRRVAGNKEFDLLDLVDVGDRRVAETIRGVEEKRRQERGATTLQSLFRGRRARQEAEALRRQAEAVREQERLRQEEIQRRTVNAQTARIQRAYRGVIDRRYNDPRLANIQDPNELEFARRNIRTVRRPGGVNPELTALFDAFLDANTRVPPRQDHETPAETALRQQREAEATQAKLAFIDRRAQINHGPAYDEAVRAFQQAEQEIIDLTQRSQIVTEALNQQRAGNAGEALRLLQQIQPGATMDQATRRNFMALRREADRDLAIATQAKEQAERAYRIMRGTGVPKKKTFGKGSRTIFGRGLSVDGEVHYKDFGRYIIHVPSLKYNTINIKYKSIAPIPGLPKKSVTNNFIKVIKHLLDYGETSERLLDQLTDNEIKYLKEICKKSRVDELVNLPQYDDSDDEDFNRFNLVKGEIQAGNNDPDLLKELKGFLVKYMNQKKIPKDEALELLQLITVLT